MNGEFISPVLLGAAIGMMLALSPARTMWLGLVLFVGSALLGSLVPAGLSPDITRAALRISVIAAASTIYVSTDRRAAVSLPICLCAGYGLGSSAATAGDLTMLAFGLLPTLIALAARWAKGSLVGLAFKVVASWIIAIALLSVSISLVAMPGFKPDHME